MPSPHHNHQQDSTSPGESPGRLLSRWFSIRRGSSHHYDIGGGGGKDSRSNSIETDEKPPLSSQATATRTSCGNKMPQLPEV